MSAWFILIAVLVILIVIVIMFIVFGSTSEAPLSSSSKSTELGSNSVDSNKDNLNNAEMINSNGPNLNNSGVSNLGQISPFDDDLTRHSHELDSPLDVDSRSDYLGHHNSPQHEIDSPISHHQLSNSLGDRHHSIDDSVISPGHRSIDSPNAYHDSISRDRSHVRHHDSISQPEPRDRSHARHHDSISRGSIGEPGHHDSISRGSIGRGSIGEPGYQDRSNPGHRDSMSQPKHQDRSNPGHHDSISRGSIGEPGYHDSISQNRSDNPGHHESVGKDLSHHKHHSLNDEPHDSINHSDLDGRPKHHTSIDDGPKYSSNTPVESINAEPKLPQAEQALPDDQSLGFERSKHQSMSNQIINDETDVELGIEPKKEVSWAQSVELNVVVDNTYNLRDNGPSSIRPWLIKDDNNSPSTDFDESADPGKINSFNPPKQIEHSSLELKSKSNRRLIESKSNSKLLRFSYCHIDDSEPQVGNIKPNTNEQIIDMTADDNSVFILTNQRLFKLNLLTPGKVPEPTLDQYISRICLCNSHLLALIKGKLYELNLNETTSKINLTSIPNAGTDIKQIDVTNDSRHLILWTKDSAIHLIEVSTSKGSKQAQFKTKQTIKSKYLTIINNSIRAKDSSPSVYQVKSISGIKSFNFDANLRIAGNYILKFMLPAA